MRCATCNNAIDDEAACCPYCGAGQPNAPAYDAFRYAAFISYRHVPRDAEVAQKLHTALETYRLPKGIAAPSVAGAKPHHLGRVFRDQEELAASTSLPARIREALKQSSALVVICSPDTLESAWVAQEVQLFASFHGRDRIFLALTAGEPPESVPPLLLQRTVVDDGILHVEPAEPLAADFRLVAAAQSASEHTGHIDHTNRAAARKQFAQEKLRIIAGIASCSFDDLWQRDRQRRRRRLAGGIAATVVALAIAAALIAQAAASHRDAQIQESKSLAAQSQQEFAAGDRYQAIRTALAGLPSDADPDRPVVTETSDALAAALEVYPDTSTYWRSSYAIDMPADISDMAYAPSGKWFAVLDAQKNLNVYDTITGKLKSRCTLPAATEHTEDADAKRHIVAAANTLIAAPDQAGAGTLVGFDPKTGKERWRKADIHCHALTCTDDGKTLGMAVVLPGYDLVAATLDARSGKLVSSITLKSENFPPFPTPTPCAVGKTDHDLYLASNTRLLHLDLKTKKVARAKLSERYASSIAYADGQVIVASLNPRTDNERAIPYAFESFDGTLHRNWRKRGTFAIENAGSGTDLIATTGTPHIRGTLQVTEKKRAAICTVGSQVYGYAPKTGSELFRYRGSNIIVGTGPANTHVPKLWLRLVSADGTLKTKDPAHPSKRTVKSAGMTFPARLKQAHIGYAGTDYLVVLAQSADDNKRLLAYHTDLTGVVPDYPSQVNNPAANLPDPGKRNYTTEELIARAHEALGE
jgi:hypothetical protein